MKKVLLFFLFLPLIGLGQQDVGWWNKKHNWDGVTPWQEYLVYSPKKFGPNALAIPIISKGNMPMIGEVESSFLAQLTEGDNTFSLFERGGIPFGDRVFIEIYATSLEYYNLDTIIRDERFAREQNPSGLIGGDIYFSTYLQLMKEDKKKPGIGLRTIIRTASGLHLKNARYTDAPGYNFDVSIGKTILKNEAQSLRIFGMLGFYAWQTNQVNSMQNDAVLFGGGFNYQIKNVILNSDYSGYAGYIGNGDFPMAWKNELGIEKEKYKLALVTNLGIRDNLYNTFGLSYTQKFSWVKFD